jgi:branched-chain amino acid transport system permease protein
MLLLQLLANGFVIGCNTALLALSFALIYNTTRTFHVAHGATYIASAYACYLLLIQMGWTLLAAMLVAVLVGAGLGVAMELIVYAPLARRNASMLVGLLSSLGLYVALVNVVALLFGNETKLLRPGAELSYHFGPVSLSRIQLIEIAAAAIILPIFVLLLNRTTWGKIIRAVRDDAPLANLIGINVPAVRVWVFALGSSLAAVAAILTAMDVGVDPQAGMPVLLTAAVALIVGGVGTFEGPVVGGFVLGLLQSVVIWGLSVRWSNAVTFGVLIAFMLLRPGGLVGRRRRLEESLE